MKILKLSAENIKRLSVVEITPDGSPVIVIGGKNGAGKSSVLDAIAMALGGASLIPGKPVRAGQRSGRVCVDLGDIVVTRTITAAGGGSLIVANKEGARFTSPQAMLDKLIGRLSFDPLDFERMDAKQQRETVRALVGLDTDDLDAEAGALYADRSSVNRTVKQLEGQLAGLPHFAAAPSAEVSISALTADLEAAEISQRALEAARVKYDAAAREHKRAVGQVESWQSELAEIEAKSADLKARILSGQESVAARLRAVDEAKQAGETVKAAVIDAAPIRARINEADAINQQVRANMARVQAAEMVEQERKSSQELTQKLTAIEQQKQIRLSAVTFPVPGLGCDDSGITMDGVPFEQASQAERLRVSVAMGLALNPTLKVLLVREGSALDSTSMRLLSDLAAAADAQVWVERVAESRDGVSVLIEDGAVKPALETVTA